MTARGLLTVRYYLTDRPDETRTAEVTLDRYDLEELEAAIRERAETLADPDTRRAARDLCERLDRLCALLWHRPHAVTAAEVTLETSEVAP